MIDPKHFEMPIDRYLTEEEERMVNDLGIETTWNQCEECKVTGATTDGRYVCSIQCLCKVIDVSPVTMKILSDYVFETGLAKKDDYVLYDNQLMRVYSTNSSEERLRRKYRKTYSYVLVANGVQHKLFDQELPLRKLSFEQLDYKDNSIFND